MSWLDAVRYRARALLSPSRQARDADEEARFHLSLDAMQREHAGAEPGSSADAHAAARRKFGNLGAYRAARREAAGLALLDRFRQDITVAVRQCTRSPGLTAAIVLTLGLGVGANATMFAVVDQVLLSAPPGIARPEHVVEVSGVSISSSGAESRSRVLDYPSYLEFRAMTDVFEQVTAVASPLPVTIGHGADAASANATVVADRYFATLGVRPALGRFFSAEESRETVDAPVVVLTHGYWRRYFGGTADVLGRTLLVNDRVYTVIGVAQPGFTGTTMLANDFWLPIGGPLGVMGYSGGSRWLSVIGRLRPETTSRIAAARAAPRWTAWKVPGRTDLRPPRVELASLAPGLNSDRPEHRVARLLSAVALAVLLIACANVVNLLLARALGRRREIAVRLALGMSQGRLRGLFVIDSMLVAVLAGGFALLVVRWSAPLVRSILFAGSVTTSWEATPRVAIVTMAIALAAGLATSLLPARAASRSNPSDALRGGTAVGGVSHARTRFALLVVQGTLSLALLAGCGLFIRSLRRIEAQHAGLDLDRLLVVDVPWRRTGPGADLRTVLDAMRERALGFAGAEGASLSIGFPLLGQFAWKVTVPGRDSLPKAGNRGGPFMYAVTSDFHRTLGSRVRRGRSLGPNDRTAEVAVVSEGMARRLWPGQDPIGRCFHVDAPSMPACTRVIGVADDLRNARLLGGGAQQQYYIPLDGAPAETRGFFTLVIRAGEPRRIAAALRRELQALRDDLPYVAVRPLADVVAPELRSWRLGATMFGAFGVLALVITVMGVYSVLRHGVQQRARETGVRRALGAQRGDILRLVAGEGLRAAVAACILGSAAVLAASSLLADLLFQTSPRDPAVLAVVNGVILVAVMAGSALPAWRAAGIDPAEVLRSD